MEIIRLDYDKSVSQDKEAWEAWKRESNERLGLKRDAFVYAGFPPYEFVWLDSSLYRRYVKGAFFFSVYEHTVREKDPPDVLCECGSIAFEVRFEDEETSRLKCVECGKEGTC